MSIARNFRITVNLSNFFHDHRNRARIFINDDIQTISDLEERIEKIFNIKNFHLTSQNEFLPPSEDARILQKDDIIWVIQNGENYEKSFTPEISTKKITKRIDADSKKRSISLTDQCIEEELRSPKKKKKKKNLEKNQDSFIEVNSEPKKKKKKTIIDIHEQEIKNIEIKYNSTKKKKIKEKKTADYSLETKESPTLEEEVNSPKSNVMKIDTLLPVLQSHINTYNKKMSTNLLNKTVSSSIAKESPSSTVTKEIESDNEKIERYPYKGNLSQYKRNIPVPTITDKYLEQKKVNIVKIEYLNDKDKMREDQLKICYGVGNGNTDELLHEIFNQTKKKKILRDDQNELSTRDIKYSETPLNDTNIDLIADVLSTKSTLKKVDSIVNFDDTNNVSMVIPNKSEITKSLNSNGSLNQDLTDDNVTHDLNSLSTRKDLSSIEKSSSTHDFFLSKNISEANSSLSPHFEKSSSAGELRSPTEICNVDSSLKDIGKKETPSDINTLISTNIPGDKSKIIVKRPKIPLQQKYFSFKGSDSKKYELFSPRNSPETLINNKDNVPSSPTSKENLVDVQNISNFDKSKLEEELSDNEVKKVCTNDLPNQTNYLETPNEIVSSFTNNVNCPDLIPGGNQLSETTTMELDVTTNTSLLSKPENKTNNLEENFAEDSKTSLHNDHRTATSTADITPDISNLSNHSNRISKGASRFFKQKQQSGIGQFLEELRSNESAISVESLESDYSEFVTKRKRKRTRKRKKKADIDSNTSLNDSSLISEPFLRKPLNVKACPSIHIKFEDDEGEDLKITDVSMERNSEIEDEFCMENVTIKSDLNDSNLEKLHIKEVDIVKSPSMEKLVPKVGDFIAFKIVKITENYTPEISSYITGKVLQYNTETKRVTYEILSGLEQCEEPKGKLSVGVDLKGTEVANNQHEFAWVDLIDPRLLYP